MYLADIIQVNPSDKHLYRACDDVCFKSKNMFNAALYVLRQDFFEKKPFISEYDLYTYFQKTKNPDYYALNTMTSNYVVKQAYECLKSFFGLLRLKKQGKYNHKVTLPKYLPKDGRNVAVFYKARINIRFYEKDGLIRLSKTEIKFKTRIPLELIQEVKIVPKNGFYEIQVIYKKEEKPLVPSKNFAAIDLGINNLATVVTTNGIPFIVSGRKLKSINQGYNKRVSKMQSQMKKGVHKTKRKMAITNKRNRRVIDYLHKASRIIIDELKNRNVSKVVIGYNKEWKTGINIGKRNNQNFVQIPHKRLANFIRYKGKLEGIEVLLREESYTSKCSFLDNEEICHHNVYMGKRIKRGLFMASNGTLINADVNAAYNILKKHLGISFKNLNPIEVCSSPYILRVAHDFKQPLHEY